MKIRIALIALLLLGSAAHADEGRGPRTALDARRVELRALKRQLEGVVRTETTVVAPRQARLDLESFGGEIVVSGWDRDAVRIVADHAPDTRVGVTVQRAAVVVRSRRQVRVPEPEEGRRVRVRLVSVPARVDYRLSVPRGTSLRLSGVDSEIRVDGVGGDVSAATVNGSVRVRGGRGAVRVEAIDGAVEVIGACALVEASSVSGDLRYEGGLRPGGEYRFETHSGDVTVVLPERPDAAVRVETYDGSFQSSFPVPVRPSGPDLEFEFQLGDGSAQLELASFSGAIRLVRAGPAPDPRSVRAPRPKAPPAPPSKPK